MKSVKVLFLLILSLGLLLLVLQNTAPIEAHFLWFSAEVPAIVLLFLTAVGSFAAGLLVSLFTKTGAKSKKAPPTKS